MKFLLRTTSALAFAATALAASAQTITFENLVGTGTQSTISSVGNTVASGGYTFTTAGANGLGFYPNGNFGSYPGNYTGSVALFNLTANTTTVMTKTDSGAFGITSLQVANVLAENDSRALTFVGTHPDGTTVTQTTPFTLGPPLTTITLIGFTNLASLTLPATVPNVPTYQFDNIVVNAVPEPSALAALGLGAVAFVKRRKRA